MKQHPVVLTAGINSCRSKSDTLKMNRRHRTPKARNRAFRAAIAGVTVNGLGLPDPLVTCKAKTFFVRSIPMGIMSRSFFMQSNSRRPHGHAPGCFGLTCQNHRLAAQG